MLISLGTSKASEARGHFGSAWGRLGEAFPLTGKGEKTIASIPKELRNRLLLDRQGEQPIASMPR